MRHGKDSTYILPILIVAINQIITWQSYKKGLINQYYKKMRITLCCFDYTNYLESKQILIPKSSFHRVRNYLVKQGFLKKVNKNKYNWLNYNAFYITKKGIIFLLSHNKNRY